jgi:hypothetical protein
MDEKLNYLADVQLRIGQITEKLAQISSGDAERVTEHEINGETREFDNAKWLKAEGEEHIEKQDLLMGIMSVEEASDPEWLE